MKKIFLMALIAIIAAACSSKEIPFGKGMTCYNYTDFQGKTSCIVRDAKTHDKILSQKDGYNKAVYYEGIILAFKNETWTLFAYDNNQRRILAGGKTFTAYNPIAGSDMVELADNTEKYLYFSANDVLYGPVRSYEYHGEYNFAFISDGSKFGALETTLGKQMLPVDFENLVYAVADDGKHAFYCDNLLVPTDGKLAKPLTARTMAAMKKEAKNNDTPWPEKGYGIVKVKTLR